MSKQPLTIWCDFIERDFLENKFQNLIKDNYIKGATSNPSIFANSILNSPAYKSQIISLKGNTPKSIYENIAIADIKRSAKIMQPLWLENKDNGYISIEIDPTLAENISKSIDEGKRLHKIINEPNVMIKVPATSEGYEIMSELSKNNIPINATLIFSPEQAKECMEVFTKNPKNKAVISVFVSRFDRASDHILKNSNLNGKLGILNAQKCYTLIEKYNNPNIRTLFASTGIKGDDFEKTYYIKNLYLPHSVNTAPLDTIEAYIQEGFSSDFITPLSESEISKQLQEIQSHNINLEQLYKNLIEEGLNAFIQAFENLLRNF